MPRKPSGWSRLGPGRIGFDYGRYAVERTRYGWRAVRGSTVLRDAADRVYWPTAVEAKAIVAWSIDDEGPVALREVSDVLHRERYLAVLSAAVRTALYLGETGEVWMTPPTAGHGSRVPVPDAELLVTAGLIKATEAVGRVFLIATPAGVNMLAMWRREGVNAHA